MLDGMMTSGSACCAVFSTFLLQTRNVLLGRMLCSEFKHFIQLQGTLALLCVYWLAFAWLS